MPRAIRVGDVDNDRSHPGDPGPNRMIENDATVWIDEGGSNAGLAGSSAASVASALGVTELNLSEAETAQLNEQVQRDLRNQIRPSGQEYLETTEGNGQVVNRDSSGQQLPPAQIGQIQEPPPGAEGAHPDWNTFPENPNNDRIVWAGSDSRVDPAIYTIATRMAASLGTTITCNSGYRDRARNDACDGASNSKHMYGKAMDLRYIGSSNEDKRRMLVAAIESGAQGIGLYNSFIHIDLGPKRTWNRPQPGWASATMSSAGY